MYKLNVKLLKNDYYKEDSMHFCQVSVPENFQC